MTIKDGTLQLLLRVGKVNHPAPTKQTNLVVRKVTAAQRESNKNENISVKQAGRINIYFGYSGSRETADEITILNGRLFEAFVFVVKMHLDFVILR